MLFINQSFLKCQKINHVFTLQGSITPNMGVIGPICDDEDELI
jgi:hypothetical protein